MDAIKRALTFHRSTILFSPLGLRPNILQFYFKAIRNLIPLSLDEPWFLYKGRILFVCIEPPFGARIAPHVWQIVFTSHLNLKWNPLTTRIENLHIPFPRVPRFIYDETSSFPALDLNTVIHPHEAFLKICTFLDRFPVEWSLKCPEHIRKTLVKSMKGGGPYQSYLETILY